MSKKLAEHTEMELLHALLLRSKLHRGPFRTTWTETPQSTIIGIGKDHHADIYIGDEDYAELKRLVERTDYDADARREHKSISEASSGPSEGHNPDDGDSAEPTSNAG